MNVKSQSKKIFNNKIKLPLDPLIKRHKSQESYTDLKTIQQEKSKFNKGKTTITLKDHSESNSNFILLNKNKNIPESDKKNKSKLLEKQVEKPVEKFNEKMIFTNRDDSIRVIETEENVFVVNNNSNNSNNNIKNLNEDINNANANLKIIFTENKAYEDNCIDDLEDMRCSEIFTDFYTNSICEASDDVSEEAGVGLINNLPQTFVKHAEKKNNKLGKEKEEANDNKVKERLDSLYRKLLNYAKKGDRDCFLENLSKIYKIEGNKTNINFKDETGWSSLHYASDEGNLKIIEILIKFNVDVNQKTNNKKTPLHLAVDKGYFDVSRILIENGATLNSLDDEKNSLIHICSNKGHVELLKYLLERFPAADTKNIYSKTPIELAKTERIRDILKDYLTKSTPQYHKITIHETNNKSANNLIYNTISKKKLMTKAANLNQKNLHNKFQSNEYCNNLIFAKQNSTPILNQNGGKIKKISNIQSSTPNNKLSTQNASTKSTTTSNFSNKLVNKKNINEISNSSAFNNTLQKTNTQDSIKRYFDDKIDRIDNICNSEEEYEEDLEEDEETFNPMSSIEEERIGPNSFICHALIGKGSFGEVYLVEKKNTGTLYAMKVLNKDKIMAQNLIKYAMTERNVLSVTDHPFIVKLSFSFQSSDRLFLILDYCPGGDLAEHLSREKKFTEERAKIYLCEIILALDDLHRRDIIFRDLKPDNVVLDLDGHAQLTDFGLSKEGVLDNKGAKSFCGSVAYLAPEMLKRTGHGKSVDWYLLGVLFYEMIVGVPPYFTNNKYIYLLIYREQLFKNIESADLQYPKSISHEGVSLLKGVRI